MTIELTPKQKAVLTAAYEAPSYDNGYQALKAQLSSANKAKLRGQCNTDGYISDRDLIYAIINQLDESGLDL